MANKAKTKLLHSWALLLVLAFAFSSHAQDAAELDRMLFDVALKVQITETLQKETTNFFNELTDDKSTSAPSPYFVIVNKSFTNSTPEEKTSCDYGDFPTNITFLITNKYADTLLEPEAAHFYFSGGDLADYLGKPFKFSYRWNGSIRGEFVTLFYLNTKNQFGGYVGKKLYAIRTYTKNGETTYTCSRCECFINAVGKDQRKNASFICYPDNFKEDKIKSFNFGGGTGVKLFDATKIETWPWSSFKRSIILGY